VVSPSTGGIASTGGNYFQRRKLRCWWHSEHGRTTGGAKATGGAFSAGGTTTTGRLPNGRWHREQAAAPGQPAEPPVRGGAAASGGSTGTNSGCPGADATEFALVQAWLNNTTAVGALPNYAYSNIKKNFPAGAAFDRLACSIAMSCAEFAPMETDWLRKCEAVVTSAIVAESSYNPNSARH